MAFGSMGWSASSPQAIKSGMIWLIRPSVCMMNGRPLLWTNVPNLLVEREDMRPEELGAFEQPAAMREVIVQQIRADAGQSVA